MITKDTQQIMSDPIKWLDRDDGPVNYGEPTYWERRCKKHQVARAADSLLSLDAHAARKFELSLLNNGRHLG